MPVKTFRRLEEAERSLWRTPGDPAIRHGFVRRWQLHRFFAPEPERRRPPGVYKYQSIEEKQREQT